VRPILVPAFVVLVERIKTRSPARAHADKPALVTPAEHVS
jgi:hypothetical protein